MSLSQAVNDGSAFDNELIFFGNRRKILNQLEAASGRVTTQFPDFFQVAVTGMIGLLHPVFLYKVTVTWKYAPLDMAEFHVVIEDQQEG